MRSVAEVQKGWATIFEGPIGVDLRTSVRDGDGVDPCEAGLRSVCWKSFLLYGPVSQSTWPKKLAESRSVYVSLRDHYLKFIDHPDSLYSTADPLADDETSPWSTLRQDEEARAEIFQDVIRTYQDNFFFKEPETQRKLLDILFIFSKLNPDTGYRQGMHELLATLLWVVHQDAVNESALLPADREKDGAQLMIDTLNSRWVEADAFTLFCAVMQNVKSSYETGDGKDSAPTPIIDRSRKIHEELLATYDPELALRLQVLGILPQIYAIRWIRLLFAREFEFKETLRLWDILFAENIQTWIVDLTCVALLLRMRWDLMEADYSTAITSLTRVKISSGDQDPRSLVRDALVLDRNRNQETGADLIQASTGRRPKAQRSESLAKDRFNSDQWPPTRGLRTPQHRQSAASSPPARFSSPQRQLENLFQNVSSGIQQRTEGWTTVSRAVRSAVGEVRKNVNNLQPHSRQGSTSASPDPTWTRRASSRDERQATLEMKQEQLERKIQQLEARNKALAKMLDGALASLRSMNENNKDDDEKEKREENFNISLARIQFVSVYLSDPEIPIPAGGEADVDNPQTGQITKNTTAHPPSEPNSTGEVVSEPVETEAGQQPELRQENDKGEESVSRNATTTSVKKTSPPHSPRRGEEVSSGGGGGSSNSNHLRPSLTDSSFSFMLGENPHRSSFISAVADLPEQRRESQASEPRTRPKQLWAAEQPQKLQQKTREAGKNSQQQRSGAANDDDDDGFTLSSLRRGKQPGG